MRTFFFVFLFSSGICMSALSSNALEAESFSITTFSKAAESAITYLKEKKIPLDNGACLLGIRKEYYDFLPDEIKSKFKNPNVPIFVVTYGYLTPLLHFGGCLRVFVNSETYKVLCIYGTK